mgnify:CR=1 FL=1|tara:strand:- start:463 stop:786 length:324 start_codon:yes stop_codon:yes gene_type:complete
MLQIIYINDTPESKIKLLRTRAKKLLLKLLNISTQSHSEPVTPIVCAETGTPVSKRVLSYHSSEDSFRQSSFNNDDWSCSTMNSKEFEEYMDNYTYYQNNQDLREQF